MDQTSSPTNVVLLTERTIHKDPIAQFNLWYEDAVNAKIPLPNAMTLATASAEGKPSARIVLLKEVADERFIFYTNYMSRKSRELKKNPFACLVFYWSILDRQVRIEGSVDEVSAEESDRYFQTRPRDSQIGALASPQSERLPDRATLEARYKTVAMEYEGKPIPRPAHWGGFRLKPSQIEFWQNREARLHDRFLYTRTTGEEWTLERLAP